MSSVPIVSTSPIFDFIPISRYLFYGLELDTGMRGFSHWDETWADHGEMHPTPYHALAALHSYILEELL